jgi:hypothetical protein
MSAAKFRKERAQELRMLNQILQKSSSCQNAHILNDAAGVCINNKPNGADSWGYTLDGLRFEIKTPQNTLPNHVGEILDVEVNFNVAGDCKNADPDAFIHLNFELAITHQTADGTKNICTWHFDRHIEKDSDEDEPNLMNEIHPLYHFQHGGHAMKSIAESLGQVLVLTAPRIPFPPMDALLVVDFILSNFAGDDWKALREDGDYCNWVGGAQKRYWEPYIKMLMSFWEPGPKDRNNISRFWPNLIYVR